MNGEQAIDALREALHFSPDNVPLRQHLAESLLQIGRAEEAEREFRMILAKSPDHNAAKTSLAQAFYQQGKFSESLVLIESLVDRSETLPTANLLYARLLLRADNRAKANDFYRRAVAGNASLADEELASRIGNAGAAAKSEDENSDEPKRIRVPVDGAGDDDDDRDEAEDDSDVERPEVGFKDVGGMDAVKNEIGMKIIHPLKHAELYAAYGKKIGGGILMYGPPGCGKTHLARATAGEIDARFMAIGINDVLDMWIGSSEKNLHALFEKARHAKPCVLFFDEVDALASSRADMRQSSGRHLINQFLSELDGIQANNDGLLILAATNAPWHVDSAFRRPGRFDRILFVPPPDEPARAAISRILLTGKPTKDVDYEQLAKKTEGFSGADLKAVVDQAIEAKLRDAMRDGVPSPLTTKDLLASAKRTNPSTREWFSTAKNYALYSNQGGVYDDILKYLKM